MLQTKFITNHNKLPFSLNYSTKHPYLVAWLLGCFTSILEIIGTSIKKGKMMIYEEEGWPEDGIEPGTAWEEIPEDWVCPDCGVSKEDFEMVEI